MNPIKKWLEDRRIRSNHYKDNILALELQGIAVLDDPYDR
jgi:hypothetical protein